MNKNEQITARWLTTLCSDFARFYIVSPPNVYTTFPVAALHHWSSETRTYHKLWNIFNEYRLFRWNYVIRTIQHCSKTCSFVMNFLFLTFHDFFFCFPTRERLKGALNSVTRSLFYLFYELCYRITLSYFVFSIEWRILLSYVFLFFRILWKKRTGKTIHCSI